MCYRIVSGEWQKHADPPHPVGLLRARRKRPCHPPSIVINWRRSR